MLEDQQRDHEAQDLSGRHQKREHGRSEEPHSDGACIGAKGRSGGQEGQILPSLRILIQETPHLIQLPRSQENNPSNNTREDLHTKHLLCRIDVDVLVDKILEIARERVQEHIAHHQQHPQQNITVRVTDAWPSNFALVILEVPDKEADQRSDDHPFSVVQGIVEPVLHQSPDKHHWQDFQRLHQVLHRKIHQVESLVLHDRRNEIRRGRKHCEPHVPPDNRQTLELAHTQRHDGAKCTVHRHKEKREIE
mmetsp:Transcript_51982/g.111219  ORF Transcript_51982/g.111219 Transcript_51982/m.111219 type:complete len:250 (-) Transcript_51982:1757-2506(-)